MTSRRRTLANDSRAYSIASLTPAQRQTWLQSLDPEDALAVIHSWHFWARGKQLAPSGDWRIWFVLAGRGFGKTRTGSEWVREQIWPLDQDQPKARQLAFVGRTRNDVRKVMVKGKSGFMNVLAPWQKAHYKATTREIICYNLDGSQRAVINLYTAEEPDELRGPEHDGFWADELAAWKYADAWDQLNFGLRIGDNPRGIITTTPRPNRMVRALLKDADTVVTRGTTYENAANVNKKWLNQLLKKYEGTTLGRQELEAQVLDEMPGALWTRALLDSTRVASPFADGYLPTYSTWRLCPHPDLMKIVIGVDPAVTAEEGSDETGIGAAGYGENEHGFVLEDATARYKPKEWADKTVELFKRWEADCVVAEVNQGGDLVAQNIHAVDPSVPVVMVHAHKSKYSRAQPIATWYEKGEVHHVGVLEDLEDEQCNFVPGVSKKSPNRLDWSVYALTELMGNDVLTAAPELEGLMQ